MSNKKIIIGASNGNKRDGNKPFQKEDSNDLHNIRENADSHDQQEPLDENLWGNDYQLNKSLDSQMIADKRLFVRVRYIQEIVCTIIRCDEEAEPVELEKPILFTIIDISVAGIGVISDHEINIGTILVFDLTLDNITYKVNYIVVYCVEMEGKFRVGLKMAGKDKEFTKHLKIVVARISLNSRYGGR